MQILPLQQAPTRMQAVFFRTRSWPSALVSLVTTTLFGVLVYKLLTGEVPLAALLLGGLVLLIFGGVSSRMFYKSLLASNWLLAAGPDRLWIKFRSYLNNGRPPEDLQIVEITHSEIESACTVRRVEHTIQSGNRKQTAYYRFLELALRQPVSEALTNALRKERQKTGWQDHPLTVKADHVLRLRLNGMHPGRKKLLALLQSQGIELVVEKRETEDYTRPLEDKRQMESQILTLAEQGRKIDAIKLARHRYGMTLTAARQFVDELSR